MISTSKKKYLLVLGREALDRDSFLYQQLLNDLQLHGFEVKFDPMDRIRFAFMRRLGTKNLLVNHFLLPFFRALYVVIIQRQLIDFLRFALGRISSLEFRTRVVARYIEANQANTSHLVVLARSAGSLVISRLANQLAVDDIICLGYPFKHPDEIDESFRIAHLAELEKPMLIFQGLRDPYGGREVVENYALSPQIKVAFVDVDHDFNLNQADLKRVKSEIEKVLLKSS